MNAIRLNTFCRPFSGSMLSLLVMTMLFWGCSPSADYAPEYQGKTVNINAVSICTDGAYTRSVTAVTSGKLGIFRTNNNGYTVQNNVEYSYDGTSWTSAVSMSIGYFNAHLGTYYPYGAAGITYASNPAAVTITSQKYTEAQDLCYDGLTNVSTANCELSLTLKHAYSKITFIIKKKDATYASSAKITNISISHGRILKANTLSIINGTYGTGTAGTVSYDPGISSIAVGDSAVTAALMVPVTTLMTGNITMTFKIDGVDVSTVIDAEEYGLTKLEAGQNYIIPVKVSGTQASITKVYLDSWSTGLICSADVPKPIINAQPESNCYIVKPGAVISIPISRVTTAGITTLTSTLTAGVLWTEGTVMNASSLVNKTENGKGYIQLTAGTTDGNAVVFIKDSNGTIIWSWHIWVTSYNPNTDNFTANGYTWMKRNLGALTYDTDESCFGLYYQTGRKDPFRRFNSKLEGDAQDPKYFINHPDLFCSQNNPNAGGWSKTVKTTFDPCPSGWKIPPQEAWSSLWNATYDGLNYYGLGAATGNLVPQYEYGYYFSSESKFGFWAHSGLLYNDASWDNGDGASNVWGCGKDGVSGWTGRRGCYWANSDRISIILSGNQNYKVGFGKQDGYNISMMPDQAHDASINNSCSIRCVKE